MPYVVRKTNGTIQLILEDGLIDDSTGLYLVGRGANSYGEFVADNFIRLLENFANESAPGNPLDGQIWFDSSIKQFKYWADNQWNLFAEEGPAGATGPRGLPGPTGATGPVGDPGPQGYRGYTGSVGATGIQGQIGPKGDVGYTGSRGATGYVGSASTIEGPVGYTGSRGATGATGAVGYVGSRGATGAIGPDGPQGASGLVGATGATGPGMTGDLDFTGHTISGTTIGSSITLNPLGTGQVIVGGNKLTPMGNLTASLGDASRRWTDVYTTAVRFNDGTSLQTTTAFDGATPPTTSKGKIGDIPGKIAFDTGYLYYCFGSYNGFGDIWKRMPWDGTTW